MYPIKKLGEISTLIMGQSPKSETYNAEKIGLPFYQGKKEFGEFFPIPEIWCSDPIKIVEKDDILISVRAPVGPTNLCQETSCIGRGLAGVRPNCSIVALGFLRYFFKKYENEIADLGKGSTFASITKSDLENLQIPLPPLPLQEKIVSKLDTILGNIEKQICLTEKNLKNISENEKSVLENIFKKCESEFEATKLGEICEIIGGGTPKTEIAEYWGDEIVWLSPTDLPEIGEIVEISDSAKKISKLGLQKSSAKLLPIGTVIFSSRATIGKIAINTKELSTNQGFTNFICSEKILNKFLAYSLKHFTQKIVELSNSTTFKEVNKTNLRNFEVPLPPLPKQQEIVQYLDEIFSKNTILKEKFEKNLKNLKELKQSVLKEAFENEDFIQ